MRPGPLLIRLTLVIAALALLVPLFVWIVWAVAALLVVLFAAAVAEGIALRRMRFHVDRPAKLALPLDEHDVTSLRITTTSAAPLSLIIRQRWPEIVLPRSTTVRAICRPGEALQIELPLRAIARGTATIEPAHASVTLRGLTERIVSLGGDSTLHVLPNLKAVKRMHKRLNAWALRSAGARQAPRIGKGREFDRLRDYVLDDDYRDIAWRASARHGRLIVREFRLDRSQEILLCLDSGHRMAARVEQITRLDHAVNAAVLISYICNRMEDKVGVVSFDTAVDKGVAVGRGAPHLRAITAYVTGAQAEYRHTDY